MSRLILILLAVPLVLILVAVVLLPMLLDEQKVLELATNALHEQTGATLTVNGDASLSVFPTLGVSLQEAAIAMPGEQEPGIQVRALQIGVELLPLLSRSVEIDTVALDGLSARIQSAEQEPAVDTSKFSDEQLDAFYAERRKAMAESGEAAGAEAALAVPLALNVQRLTVTDSRVELVDSDAAESTVIELDKLQAEGLNLDARPIPLELRLRLLGEDPIELELDGSVRISQADQNLSLDEMTAVVTGATAQPVVVKVQGDVDLASQVADLKLALELGETRGDGSLRYASFESPQIDTSLKLNLFDPALLVLAGPEAAAEASSEPAPDTGDEPLPLDAIRAIDTRADLSIDRLVFDAHTINDMELKLRAVEGVIKVNSLTGELHGGKLALQATLDGKHNTAKLNSAGDLTDLEIATALKAMESEQVLTGKASLGWFVGGKGRTVNELIAGLKGPIKLNTEQVVLQDTNVEQMLCRAVALVNREALSANFPANTSFETISAEIKLKDGKARLNPLRAELPQIKLNGSGVLDLTSLDLEATFKAGLSPELAKLDPACRVSERLTGIDWPVSCKGNLNADPADLCSVDTSDIIGNMAKQEVQRKVEKEAGKLFEKLLNKDKKD